jgi:glucose-6-phosphate isomerase
MTHFRQTIRSPFPLDQVKAQQAFKSTWATVQTKLQEGAYPFLEILKDNEGLTEILTVASDWGKRFQQIVVLGTGGSSLGGKTLGACTQNPFAKQRVIFMDNVDPQSFEYLFAEIDLKKTGFLVISKSGSTAETICQYLCILKLYRDANYDLGQHFLMITEPKSNTLRALGESIGCQILDHSTTIGGRFSVFSNVGLLPAAIAGIDVKQVRQGALEYAQSNLDFVIDAAALQFEGIQKGYDTSVMIPYVDALQSFASWYCQLWAESLGKDGKGTTPIRALGTVDQHSQLQLYRDGPQNKCFTFLYGLKQAKDYAVATDTNDFPDLSYLQNKTMGELLEAEMHATSTSLIKQNCPTRLIAYDRLNEKTLGSLLAHFMIETIFMAELLQVNAFDQPGVEESKVLTRQFLKERVAS